MKQKHCFKFHREDHEFGSFGSYLCEYLKPNLSRLNLILGDMIKMETAVTIYVTKLGVAGSNNNHGHADVIAKNEAKADALSEVEDFINKCLRNNAEWTLVDSGEVGFRDTDKTRTPRPAVKTCPEGVYLNGVPGRLKAKFRDAKAKNIGRAPLADSIDISITFANGDGTSTVWVGNFPKARATLRIPRELCNKKGGAKARWRNTNPEQGPWSDSVPVFCLLQDDAGA
ncbi:hypothetical protein FACS1894137_02530 [Spirochaetia bacterium]|nr:hypothetical protein FACS1894137_02530 [Spirochaetia bacterium]